MEECATGVIGDESPVGESDSGVSRVGESDSGVSRNDSFAPWTKKSYDVTRKISPERQERDSFASWAKMPLSKLGSVFNSSSHSASIAHSNRKPSSLQVNIDRSRRPEPSPIRREPRSDDSTPRSPSESDGARLWQMHSFPQPAHLTPPLSIVLAAAPSALEGGDLLVATWGAVVARQIKATGSDCTGKKKRAQCSTNSIS